MDAQKAAIFVVSITVCVMVLATTLLPAILTTSDDTAYYHNAGVPFAAADSTGTVHTITISAGTDNFVITTDGKTDVTPSLATYNPGGEYVAPAIAIGVYESYSDNGTAKSIAGVTPTSTTWTLQREYALSGNTENYYGTYELWNYWAYTLYKMMGTAIMGSTSSQDMMGQGDTTAQATGHISAPYTKWTTTGDGVSLLIENPWGSLGEFLGDTRTGVGDTPYSLQAGNALGGARSNMLVSNVLSSAIALPEENATYITTIYTTAEGWGVPATATGTVDANGIPDMYKSLTNEKGNLLIGGYQSNVASMGLYEWDGRNTSNTQAGGRLEYIMPNYTPTATSYGYVLDVSANGTVNDVKVLIDGTLTSKMPTGTTLNSYWNFDTTTGIGPFGVYYAAINLADIDTDTNTDYAREHQLSLNKGEVAYILNPNNWTRTLAGNAYTSGQYNIMMIIPTVYWGVADGKLYMSDSDSTFSDVVADLEMKPYAHTYTVNPQIDTGNPVTTASCTLVYGNNWIVRLYSTGDVSFIRTGNIIDLGKVIGDDTVTLKVTNSTLTYTPYDGNATDIGTVLAYIAHTGKYVQTRLPYWSPTSGMDFIIGGYANNLQTTEGDQVDIGYCMHIEVPGGFSTATEFYAYANDNNLWPTATVLDPVSDASNTVSSTTYSIDPTDPTYSNLYRMDNIYVETTWSDTGTSMATYNYYLAPASVAYENPEFVDNPLWNVLIVLVGTLCVVAVTLLAVRTFGGGRD